MKSIFNMFKIPQILKKVNLNYLNSNYIIVGMLRFSLKVILLLADSERQDHRLNQWPANQLHG